MCDILVVDDNKRVLAALSDALRGAGYVVEEAATAADALARLRLLSPPRMLVTDMDLNTSINGRTLSEAAGHLLPDMPVIFITNHAKNLPLQPSDQCSPVLLKPFLTEQLVTSVRERTPQAY